MRHLRNCPGLLALLALLVAAFGWICFAGSRLQSMHFDSSFPRPFPYPDGVLQDILDWLDATNPPTPGGVQLHGNYDTLFVTLLVSGSAISLAIALTLIAIWARIRRESETPTASNE